MLKFWAMCSQYYVFMCKQNNFNANLPTCRLHCPDLQVWHCHCKTHMLVLIVTCAFISLISCVSSFSCSNGNCGSLVNCTNVTNNCTVTCNSNGGCQKMQIHCPIDPNQSCNINCIFTNACYDIQVRSYGSSVYVTTSGDGYPHQIENSVIRCHNNNNCIIDCNLGSGSACNATNLYCQNVNNCLYDCSGNHVSGFVHLFFSMFFLLRNCVKKSSEFLCYKQWNHFRVLRKCMPHKMWSKFMRWWNLYMLWSFNL